MGFSEVEGTVTNIESRVLKVNRLAPGPGQSREDWSILSDLATRMGVGLGFTSAQQISEEIEQLAEVYRGVTWERLDWEDRDGIVVGSGSGYVPVFSECPRVSIENGKMALHYARTMYDDGVMTRESPSLKPLAPGAGVHLHPYDAARLGLDEGDPATVTSATGSVESTVVIDPTLHRGVVYIPFNQPGTPPLGSAPEVMVSG